MLPNYSPELPVECEVVAPGEVLRVRNENLNTVLHLVSGRVQLGIREDGQMRHQLGVVEGPFWLEATAAVLGLPSVVDGVSETAVTLRRVPLSRFQASLKALPVAAQAVLHDVAQAHRQQTELAASRLAKDAEARCAEWLLRHAEPAHDPAAARAVLLRQRKRTIAAQLGIAPETFSRVLRQLRERHLISGSGRVLNLLDPTGLRVLAGA